MKLLKLSLKNFKGAPEFVFEPNGHNASVFGDNATCKTTLVDASHWLLFDKDSHDKKDFAIKTLDKDGNVIHNLEHEVEGVYEIDGKVVTLRKVFSEKWTKKRGQTRSEFTGHTTDYYIDGVPKPKKDYDSFIAGIINEDIFKMLTNPQYFNEMLHWQARREILLDVCGDLSDEEVIASSKALSKLPEILKGRKLEDHRKVIAARRAEINKELDKIPVRIDEVSKSLPDITQSNVNGLQAEIEKLQEQIREKEQELHRIETGGEISEKQLKIREIDAALLQLKNEHRIKFKYLGYLLS